MNRPKERNQEITYRKRADPYKIVPLDSLRKTNMELRPSNETLVCGHGRMASLGAWKPLPRLATPVEVSPSSWKGLRARVMAHSDGIGASI